MTNTMNDYPAPRRRVIYFDLFGTLVEWTALGFQPRAAVAPWLELSGDYRMGILCNAKGRHTRDVQRVIEEAGLAGRFAPELLIVATDLPCPLPDRRAFAVAAALAEMPTEACLFVSADQALLVAAAAAGMRTAPLAGALEAAGMDVRALTTALEEATSLRPGPLLAAVIDEDSGPTFALKGRIVTMNSRGHVFPNGRLVIRGGKIAAVREEGEPLPAWFSGPEIDTGGTIYPGLIDLHNHFVYNVLPLWPVTKRYTNRGQWPRAARYTSEISLPVRALASHAPTARALVRYVEAKALAGGTTTGQGIRTRVDGGTRLFRGAMRNVEETDDPRLPEAGTLVVNLMLNEEGIASFRRALQTRVAYFYHLSEGVDDQAAGFWADLLEHDLVQPSLAGIHALGVPPDGLRELGRRGAKIVWSPFSNLLLYGQTLDLEALKDAGVTWSIGCDWSPTGSKNLLQELKVARYVAGQQQVALSDEALVRAVTVNAARVVGWHEHLGVLRRGTLADVLVIHGADGDPYAHLVDATEEQVALVLVHGVARLRRPADDGGAPCCARRAARAVGGGWAPQGVLPAGTGFYAQQSDTPECPGNVACSHVRPTRLRRHDPERNRARLRAWRRADTVLHCRARQRIHAF